MHAWCFAEIDTFSAITRHMQRASASPGAGYFVITVCSIAAIWLALQWMDRFRIGHSKNAQTLHALFLELCQTHRLNRTERRLLFRAAEDLPPEQVCCIFIDPRILGRLSISNSPDVDGYAKLASKLFGDCQG